MINRHLTGDAANASQRPWRVEYVTRRREAVVKAANDAAVCVCHADNAEAMVAAVNAMGKVAMRIRVLSRDGMKPEQAAWLDETQRIARGTAK